MKKAYIGIDFGTTKTLVSIYNENKEDAKIIRLGRGRDDIPTSVYVAEDGSFLCGEDADDQCSAEPDRYARAFKMKLGSDDAALFVPEGESYSQYTAKDLTRVFLSYIRSECEKYTGNNIDCAVITRPVRFSPMQCKELKEAAREAGFEKLIFISEPEAAAHTFCRQQADDPFTNALIIDWGGGTLDMALVSREGTAIKTYKNYTDGIPKGGENFDDALYWLVWHHMQDEQGRGADLEADMMEPEFNYVIRKNLRLTKESLSRLQQHTLRLSGRQGAYPALKVQRDEFEQWIHSDIEEAASMACSLIKSISEPSLRPDKLILVGGSSRIPAVARLMQERTGLPCRTWDMSVEAVGLGAALVAVEHWVNKKSEPIKKPSKPAPKSKPAVAPHPSRPSPEKKESTPIKEETPKQVAISPFFPSKESTPKKEETPKTCNTANKTTSAKKDDEWNWIYGIGIIVLILVVICLLVAFWYIVLPAGILIYLYYRYKKS